MAAEEQLHHQHILCGGVGKRTRNRLRPRPLCYCCCNLPTHRLLQGVGKGGGVQGEEKVNLSEEKVIAVAGRERGGQGWTLQLCDSVHCRIFTASTTVPETDPALLPSLLPASPPSVLMPPPLPLSPPPPSSRLIRIMSSLAPPTS